MTLDPYRPAGPPTPGGAVRRVGAWIRTIPGQVNADLRSSVRIISPRSLARAFTWIVWAMTLPPLVIEVVQHGARGLLGPFPLLAAGCSLAVVPMLVLPPRQQRYVQLLLLCTSPSVVYFAALWSPTQTGRTSAAIGLNVIPLAAFMMWGRRLGVLATLVTVVTVGLLGATGLVPLQLVLILLAVVANCGLMLGWAAHTAERLEQDQLTGLSNRRGLDRILEKIVGDPEATDHSRFLAVLDVDGIRHLNDAHGRRAVDDLLHRTGAALAARLEDDEPLFHLGAGEFAVLLAGSRRDVVAHVAALRREPADEITMCAGLAALDSATTVARLLVQAEASLARAKAAGPGSLDPLLVDDVLVQDLADAVTGGQLTVLYQPIVDLATATTIGCEALVRWDHPTRGRIGPDRFVPLAEETGLIHGLGRFVLRQACAEAASARSRGLQLQHMSVNASALELRRPDFGDDVLQVLADTGLDPRYLVLEVTESSVAGEEPEVATTLARLRQHGVRVAIDDFGTGYSSLSRLGQLPVDILKIDKSFVWADATAARDSVLVAIISLAKAFGLTTVAEGIETWDHTELLRGIGCVSGQGYLFGRPGAFEDLDLPAVPLRAVGGTAVDRAAGGTAAGRAASEQAFPSV